MKTLSYVGCTESEIEVGNIYCLGELWDGNGDGEEILNSLSVSPDNENVVAFTVTKVTENILDTEVKVTDIY